MTDNILVRKKSGEKEPFSENKVINSMQRIGLPESLWNKVLSHVKSRLYPDITTSEIFSHITEFLEVTDKKAGLKFNLKQAIFELGPTGFPFEKYLARILQTQGYKTTVDLEMRGECIMHEIDILLERADRREMVEAKFHNVGGIKTDVHVALYTYARFLDVKDNNNLNAPWIITNTKLTEDAVSYALCKDIRVVAWSFPGENNLQDLIEKSRLYPLTILRSLSRNQKTDFLARNVVLVSDILSLNFQAAREFGINEETFRKITEDAQTIYQ